MQMQHPSSQQQGLLDDLLLAPITHSWTTFSDHKDPAFFQSFGDITFTEEDDSNLASSSFMELISPAIQPTFPNYNSSYEQHIYEPKSMVSIHQDDDKIHEEQQVVVSDNQIPDGFSGGEKKSKSRKVEGQPSKNLMAERRRRKRLNERLSMLRSIVPRISKMDRTSIVGDTIEYIKELLEKINSIKEQDMESDSDRLILMGGFKQSIVNHEAQAINQPKFEVERRTVDTRVQIRCLMKPGLLLSTLNVLEALGLDIQQCVVSSFGDFTLQASCFEAPENLMTSSEDIKQILIRNASCGGRSV